MSNERFITLTKKLTTDFYLNKVENCIYNSLPINVI